MFHAKNNVSFGGWGGALFSKAFALAFVSREIETDNRVINLIVASRRGPLATFKADFFSSDIRDGFFLHLH